MPVIIDDVAFLPKLKPVNMFVAKKQQLKQLDQKILACRLCLDAGHSIEPGPVFSHPADAQVMLIGQAPGVTEVKAKRPFNAGSGRRLFQWLEGAGWQEDDFRARYVMTAVTKCYPGKASNGKGDRVPSKVEQKLCRPFLQEELEIFNPRVIILVGGLAIKLIYPGKSKLAQVIGTVAFLSSNKATDMLKIDIAQTEYLHSPNEIRKRDGCWIVPLPHPSGASLWPNKPQNKTLIDQSIAILSRLRELYNL